MELTDLHVVALKIISKYKSSIDLCEKYDKNVVKIINRLENNDVTFLTYSGYSHSTRRCVYYMINKRRPHIYLFINYCAICGEYNGHSRRYVPYCYNFTNKRCNCIT